ncbi:MAG: substrate-binding periplasmic protein [Ktedonobacterales bacterium]
MQSLTRRWSFGGGLAMLAALTMILSACGAGNASTNSTPSTGTTLIPIQHAATLIPGEFKWGEDSTGGMPYIVPQDSNNPGAPYYGFEVDIANAMAKLMGINEVPTQITWSNWPQGLQSQQFDFFMNGWEISKDNVQAAESSIPYYVYTQSIVVLKSNTTINSFADLAGKKVETGTGYEAQTIMENYNAQNPSKQIQIVATDNPTPFTDLDSHRVDAEFLDTPIAEWYGANDPSGNYKIVGGNDLFPGYYGIAFSPTNPNSPALIREMNEVISDLWLNGTLKKVYQDGGAYNSGTNNNPIFVKYDLWNNSEACIGNFMPVNPTHVANCPAFPPTS